MRYDVMDKSIGNHAKVFETCGSAKRRSISMDRMARAEPMTACIAPSIRKGPRMKPLLAPTRRMMAISLRRAKIARRMVLLMNTNAMKMSKAMSATPM